jgi:hypothetical protein
MLVYQTLATASHAATKSAGVPIATIFGTIGSAVGIVGFGTQLRTNRRRKRYEHAEEKLLEAIDSSEVIERATLEVRQYDQLKSSLRNEIETQIPKQARIAYLTDRLDQLTEDLHSVYRAYEDARRELAKEQPVSELDERIREAIELSITPARKLRERRVIYLASLVVALILFNIDPFRLNSYFYILGYSNDATPLSIVTTMAIGVICLTLIVLISLTFLRKATAPSKRAVRLGILIGGLSLVVLPVMVSGAFYLRGEAIANSQQFSFSSNSGELTEAGLLFNAVVIFISADVAAFIRFMQARVSPTRLA